MAISKEDTIQKAVDLLSSKMECRLEIVDRISGFFYDTGKIDAKNSWIIHVKAENVMLDGKQEFILVDKETSDVVEVMAS